MKKNQLVFLSLLLLCVFWIFLLPGLRVASDFHLTSFDSAKDFLNFPQTWSYFSSVDLGEYVANILWAWPVDFIYGLLSRVGFSFSILTKILWLTPVLILGVWGMRRLLSHLKIEGWGNFIGTLFYLINTYILLILDGGQFRIALAYVWLPTSYLAIVKAVGGSLKQKICAGITIAVMAFFDPRFIYILLILLSMNFIYSLFTVAKREFVGATLIWIRTGIISGIIFLGISAFWWVPIVILKPSIVPPGNAASAGNFFLSFTTWKHALLLQHPNWFENVFGKVAPLRYEFLLIPCLVFLAPILVLSKKVKTSLREKNIVVFWILIALVSLFLSKGSNSPLPNVYPWLFKNIPGFSMFRDSTKFFFLVALSYSVLIGITVDELVKRFNWSLVIGHWSLKVFPLLLTTYYLLLINPVWMGQMTGTFSEPYNKEEFLVVADRFQNDQGFSRIFWIPTKAPLGYSSPTHPAVEASRLVEKRPFTIGAVGKYETFNFLREAPFMGELFDISGIKYLAYPYPDTRIEELKQDNIDYYYAFLDQLTNLPWVDERVSEPPVAVLKTKKSQDHFFVSPNTWLVIGSDRIYSDFIKIPNFKFADNALIFAEEQPELGKILEDNPQIEILLYDKKPTDLMASFIDQDSFIFPAEQLDYSPSAGSGSSSWWKREASDLIWWRDFLQTKYGIDNQDFDYGGGWAISEGNRKLQISNVKFQKGNVLLARIMESSKGGKVEFWQGEDKIGEIDTKVKESEKVEIKLTGYKPSLPLRGGEIPDQIFEYDKADFSWYEVGKLVDSHKSLVVRTEGDINVINALISVSENDWQNISNEINEYKVIDWEDLSDIQKAEMFLENN
ncbi:hypothetical protein KKB40_06070, partial [Patescibacteria group bacterium]|nr:hypothetical protein [Patescibacteria group bacterium]